MKKILKASILMMICTFMLFVLSVVSFGAGANALVVDNEGLFTEQEQIHLETALEGISQKYQCELVVVTTSSFGSKSAQTYAENYYDNNGYGYGEKGTGVLFLISENKREYYICLTGDANDAYAHGKFSDLEDEIVPLLSKNDFYGASLKFATKSEQILEEYEDIKDFDTYAFRNGIIISIIIAIAVGIITILVMRNAMNNAKPQKNATNYIRNGSFNLTLSRDMYLYSTVRRVAKPKSNSSSRSGGGGRSHGGGGGRF